ncbi:hypothetical protein EJ05DRAFT_312327 [Pseudovirgaria hyperparasitica]|uniref:NAD dependent epimerase/dehydratase n=1 Tax=Pseudovirgaria hyperparasitica TaxID=470096 RepID=A0A6A6WE63_9PEZI|nr:uncharacterized protein EJ05DRAFT_312327 [Pseudovirgaria hyperparasitica]KAF2759867.1 hypothetical protein EJ05DRAFT_312327 [Pseudovirgaria hyperparasitica]
MRFVSKPQDTYPTGTGPKVIAAGLPRCATSSLQTSFEQHLGYGPCMHFARIAPYAERLRLVRSMALERDKATRQAMLRTLFDVVNSSADFPGMWFIEDLVEMYPDAQIILNKRRSGTEWHKSFMDTIYWFSVPNGVYAWAAWLVETDREQVNLFRVFYSQLPERYGVEDWCPEMMDRHSELVRRVARKHGKEVLEWEPADGYEPICKFLGKDVPAEPFPRTNETADILFIQKFLLVRGLAYWLAALATPVAVFYAVRQLLF